jgi:hypothetical protein
METAPIVDLYGDELDSKVERLVDNGPFNYHEAREIAAAELDSRLPGRVPSWQTTLARIRAINADRAIAKAAQDAQERGASEVALRRARGLPLT